MSNIKTVSSLIIAEVTGRDHKAILRMIRDIIKQGYFDKTMFIDENYKDKRGQYRPMFLLTQLGCKVLLDMTRSSTRGRNELVNLINNEFSNTIDTIVISSRFEDDFMGNLEIALIPMGYTVERQHQIDSYKVDAYIPELNIVIEYDEQQHFTGVAVNQDKERQTYIEDKLGCSFIRCSYMEHNSYNIGIVFNHILQQNTEVA